MIPLESRSLETPPVHVGRDGWLFLTGGSNDVLAQYRAEAFPPALLAQWRRLLERRLHLAGHLRARYLHVVVPDKLSVYDDRLDGLRIDPRLAPARRLARALRFSPAARANLDLLPLFRARRDGPPLYLRTDSHWTAYGCDLAYRAILARLGVVPRDDLGAARHRETRRGLGDLGSKLVPPRAETAEIWNFSRRAERFYADPRVLDFEARGVRHWAGGTGTHVAYRNGGPGVSRHRVLLLGDSYTGHGWQPWAGTLSAVMAETFSELHVIWSSGIDWAYVAQVRPDVIVTEIAERFVIHPRFLAAETEAILQAMERLGIRDA